MAVIKCKMCGGDLELLPGSTVAKCEYCGSTQTVPSADDEKRLLLFERAERLRKNCEFDKAFSVYESIVADFRDESEAYWGLVLCKYGIEYVDDPATGKKIPTCHRSSFESVMDDQNFEQVLENASAEARKVYRDEAKQIEELRKGILEVSSREAPYDIFICYKETALDGGRTEDSVMAQDIYDALTNKGYRVFFSRISLEDKLGQEYEPYIFAALHSAKIMLAIGTDYEYYNAVWVKNEWSRFLQLIARGEKKTLIPCFKGIDAYDMPKEFSKLQAQDMGKLGAMQDLLRGIDKLLTPETRSKQVVSDSGAMEAFLKDKANREMDESKKIRQKRAVAIAIWTFVISTGLLFFSGYDIQGQSGYIILGMLDYLIGNTTKLSMPGVVFGFLAANVAALLVQITALWVCVQKSFRSKLGFGLMCLSWLIVTGSFAVCDMLETRILPTGLIGYNLMPYISGIFMLVMTIIMNWPAKRLRFWIALVIYAGLLFAGNAATGSFQTLTYNSAVRHMKQGAYDKAIAAFAKLDDYKDSRELVVEICSSQGYLSSKEIGDTVFYGSYEQDGNYGNGAEPISWIVLDKDAEQLLLISEQALDAVAYNSTDLVIDRATTWDSSSLNSWLKNSFSVTAFAGAENVRVAESATLLTEREALQYFGSDDERLCTATPYAERNKSGMPLNANGKYDDWWLRGTNSEDSEDAPIVDTHGRISEEDVHGNNPLFQYVRPAIRVRAQ